jgi:hypothetical protein
MNHAHTDQVHAQQQDLFSRLNVRPAEMDVLAQYLAGPHGSEQRRATL